MVQAGKKSLRGSFFSQSSHPGYYSYFEHKCSRRTLFRLQGNHENEAGGRHGRCMCPVVRGQSPSSGRRHQRRRPLQVDLHVRSGSGAWRSISRTTKTNSKGISADLPHVDAKSPGGAARVLAKRDETARWRRAWRSCPRPNASITRCIAPRSRRWRMPLRFREYEQPVNADSAFWSDITYDARKTFTTVADYRNFIKQLDALPAYFSEELANMRAGLARGFTPPKVTLTGRDASLASVAEAKTPQETVFYAPFKTMPAAIPAAEQEALRQAAVAAIRRDGAAGVRRPCSSSCARSTCRVRARRWPPSGCRMGKPITSRRSWNSPRRRSPPTRSTRSA